MDPFERQLIAEMRLGEEAARFFKSDIGRLVLGRTQQEIDSALEDFKSVSPTDQDKIRALQFKIQVAEKIPLWLNECIIAGNNAFQTIDQGEE